MDPLEATGMFLARTHEGHQPVIQYMLYAMLLGNPLGRKGGILQS